MVKEYKKLVVGQVLSWNIMILMPAIPTFSVRFVYMFQTFVLDITLINIVINNSVKIR